MTLDTQLITRALPPGSMRYFAWLFADATQRDALAALLVIDGELQDSARAAHEVAHVRLQWWRDELTRLKQGAPQHPATQALARTWVQAPATAELFDEWLLGAAQELAQATFETDAELQRFFVGGSAWSRLLLHSQPQPISETMMAAAGQLGGLVREISSLRDLRLDCHHGRLYLPLGALDAIPIDYEQLQQTPWPPALIHWLTARCQTLLARWHTLEASLLQSERAPLRPLLVLAAQHAALLAGLPAELARGLPTRPELSGWRRLWTAWRMARRC